MTSPDWGANAPISIPQPRRADIEFVDFEGFCFTADGIRINMTAVDREVLVTQTYRPSGGA